MKIKDLCAEERPREKMLEKGAGAMSNAELLAILLGSGTRKGNVLEVANRLLSAGEGKLSGIAGMGKERMETLDGIGSGRYATIAAAFELGRRFSLEDPGIKKIPFCDPQMVYRAMQPVMKGLDHEEFWVIFLNASNFLIHKDMISMGGITSTVVDPKLVVKKALDRHASSMIMVHNHPSGNPRPSKEDMLQTRLVKKAAETLGICLLDHVIICDDRFYSFSEDRVRIGRSVP